LLARAGVATLSLGAAAASFGLLREYLSRYASYDGLSAYPYDGTTSPITPNSQHYVVTQNPIDPTPNLDVWRLEIAGLVGTSGSYTYEEVQKLPSTSRAITLECIANGAGGGLISTAIWQGIPLRTLLERHGGALPNARYVTFTSVDGYVVSLPLDEVLAVDGLLAWRMNGAELPLRHGFPLRVLVPGRYGEENPKWLTRVELTDHFVGGLYSDQGWYNGPLHTTSRIDRPRGHLPLGRSIEVGGIAFAGSRGISKVEVSVDGGSTWHVAKLEPPLSQDAWVLWTWQWMPSLPGRYTLVARATDGTGEVQTSHKQITVPNGATGYHQVTVEVG
jgi:DMSO/TMAO reductase YedYZ molybdopterin-dependent catalytic subunit